MSKEIPILQQQVLRCLGNTKLVLKMKKCT